MSQPISSTVRVTITRGTRSITKAGFGTPMIVAQSASFTGIRSYSSYDDVIVDFAPTSNEAKAALAIFSAAVKVPVLKIGKVGASPLLTHRLYLNAGPQPSDVYTVTVGSDTYSEPLDQVNGAPASLDALAAAINAAGKTYSASRDGTYLALTFQNAAQLATLSFSSKLSDQDANASPVALTAVQALEELADMDLDFYGVVIAARDDAQALDVAKYIETQRKVFYYATSDAAAYGAGTTDFLSQVKALNLTHTFGFYSADAADYPDAGMAGSELPSDPGSYTDKFKTMPGIIADSLTGTQISAIKGKNGNVYTTVGGVDMVSEGVVASGEFLDVIRFIDWLQAQIEENVFGLFVSTPKVPYTDKGVAMIEGQLRLALNEGVRVGGLSDYDVVVPKVADIPQSDRQARKFTGMTFSGTLAGAIHTAFINGVLSV